MRHFIHKSMSPQLFVCKKFCFLFTFIYSYENKYLSNPLKDKQKIPKNSVYCFLLFTLDDKGKFITQHLTCVIIETHQQGHFRSIRHRRAYR